MAERKDTNVEITLRRVRLSFANVFKPQPPKDGKGEPSFNCSFLIPKSDGKQLDMIEDALAECKKKMWGDNPPRLRDDRVPYRDGDDYDYDGYRGNMFVSARNPKAPQVLHSKKGDDGKFIRLRGDEGVVYSGCWANAIVRFWAQDNTDYGKRVNCSLEVVQFYDDGDAFGGASRPDADKGLDGLENKDLRDDDLRRGGDSRRDGDRDRGRDRGRDERSSGSRDADRSERGRDRDEGNVRGSDNVRERGNDRDRGRDDDRGSERGSRERESERGRDRDDDRSRERSDTRGGSDDRGKSRDERSDTRRNDDRNEERGRDRGEERGRGGERDRGEERGSRDAGSSRERDRGEGREGSRERSSDRGGSDAGRSSSRSSDREREPSGDRGRDRDRRDLI